MESKALKVCISSEKGNKLVKLLGSRGTMDILCVFCCSSPVNRFTRLSTMLPHLSPKTLAARLRELDEEGILRRASFNEIPPRVEYSMTDKGSKLIEAVMPLIDWVVRYSDGDSAVCGTDCASENAV
jgi:DNA-binding HxlR family transcriptional regulator